LPIRDTAAVSPSPVSGCSDDTLARIRETLKNQEPGSWDRDYHADAYHTANSGFAPFVIASGMIASDSSTIGSGYSKKPLDWLNDPQGAFTPAPPRKRNPFYPEGSLE
jgi:hypothetical protein